MLGTSSEYGNDAIVAIGSSNWSGSDLIRDLEVRLLELSRLTELDLKSIHGCRVFGKLWVWLIGSGIWHEARTNFGDEEFAFICNYDADKKKESINLINVDWNDIDAQSSDFCVHGASRKVGQHKGFEWFIPPNRSLGTAVSVEDARLLLSMYTQIENLDENNDYDVSLPHMMWVQVENSVTEELEGSKSQSQLWALGLSRYPGKPLEIHKISRDTIFSCDSYGKPKVPQEKLPSFDCLFMMHKSLLETNCNGYSRELQVNVKSRYDLLSERRAKPLENTLPSLVSIHTSWSGTHNIFSPPPPSAKINIKIRVTSGFRDPECHTASMTLRNEIRFLQALISLIGNDINDDSFDAFELSQKGENISQEDVELFLSAVKMGVNPGTISSSNSRNFIDTYSDEAKLGEFSITKPRSDFDFTEQLWVFCQRCKSTLDVISVFSVLRKELMSEKILPVVDKSNKTLFACIVRDIYKLNRLRNSSEYNDIRRSISFKLADVSNMPFGVLAEIGAYKILKDLRYYLTSNRLTTLDNLSSNIESPFLDTLSNEDLRIINIRCLFSIFESWTLAALHIHPMPHDWQRMFMGILVARNTLLLNTAKRSSLSNRFTNLKRILNNTVFYNINLPRFSIESARSFEKVIYGLEPNSWSIIFNQIQPPVSSVLSPVITGNKPETNNEIPRTVFTVNLVHAQDTDNNILPDYTCDLGDNSTSLILLESEKPQKHELVLVRHIIY